MIQILSMEDGHMNIRKETKYIINWAEKQGVKFTEINPHIVIRKAKNN